MSEINEGNFQSNLESVENRTIGRSTSSSNLQDHHRRRDLVTGLRENDPIRRGQQEESDLLGYREAREQAFPRSIGPLDKLGRTHEAVFVHSSVEHIPAKILATFKEINQDIAEVNQQLEMAHAEHLEKSKQEILQTAKVALDRVPQEQYKKALLLGVGNGLDIPLQGLAENFDQLTVVELDRESTESAIKKLSPDLQKKFSLVIADITGIVGEYCTKLDEISTTSKGAFSFFHKVEMLTEDTTKKAITPDVGNDYTFACSHLLLSQLGHIPYKYVGDIVSSNSKFTYLPDVDSSFLKTYDQLTMHLHREHLLYLAKSVTPLGTAHFADTYAGIQISPTKETRPLVKPQVIDSVLQEKFTPVKEKTQWLFNHTPERRQFLVISHSLELKPE